MSKQGYVCADERIQAALDDDPDTRLPTLLAEYIALMTIYNNSTEHGSKNLFWLGEAETVGKVATTITTIQNGIQLNRIADALEAIAGATSAQTQLLYSQGSKG